MPTYQDVLQFWFQGVSDRTVIDKNKPPFNRWFVKNDRFDDEIRLAFQELWQNAKVEGLSSWEKSPRSLLALVIVCDQFPRNMFRNSFQSFATDQKALTLSMKAIETKIDQQLDLIERVFLAMPLMHAEDVSIQEESVRYFEKIVQESQIRTPANTHYFQYNLSFAQSHCQIVSRFGRFPHRNKILNRENTAQETAFLAEKN